MNDGIKKIIITEEQIIKRLKTLVMEIGDFYRDKNLVVIAILKGSFIFLADFIRLMPVKMSFDFMSISSYGAHSKSTGKVVLEKGIKLDVKNKHVLLVDDIYDTGLTLKYAIEYLSGMGSSEIKTCVFLVKKKKHLYNIKIDYSAFEIDDSYVVGYGLDYQDLYRNLPYVAVIEP